jgi:hypothetical protein
MFTYGNEREVQQGEEWNLDILVSQSEEEYIPFIVSSERENPMWAITVASTKFEKNERYVATWWLDLLQGDGPTYEADEQGDLQNTGLPRFYQTVPDTTTFGEVADNTPLTRPAGDEPMAVLYQYTKASDAIDETLGHKPYYYIYFPVDDPENPVHGYECRIRMQFKSTETAEWGSQNYSYQITLVDTIEMGDYVQDAYETYPDLNWKEWVDTSDPDWVQPEQEPGESTDDYNIRVAEAWRVFRNEWIIENIVELYNFIKLRIPTWFQLDIDVDAPVGQIDIPQVILPPTKLRVNNNIRRLI